MTDSLNDKISVIMPCFNAEGTVERAIDSLLAQTYNNFELIAVNDGSTDGTLKILQDYAKKDKRIRIIDKQNEGVSSARNDALNIVTGEYVTFLDCDDYLVKDSLKDRLASIKESKADSVLSGITFIGEKQEEVLPIREGLYAISEFWHGMYAEQVKSGIYGYLHSAFFSSKLLNDLRFNKEMYSQEDLNFNLRRYSKCENIYFLKKSEYIYDYKKSSRKPDYISYIKNHLLIKHNTENFNAYKKEEKRLFNNLVSANLFCALSDAVLDKAKYNATFKTLKELKLNKELKLSHIKSFKIKLTVFLFKLNLKTFSRFLIKLGKKK